MNSTFRIEVCRVFARMWRNCSPIAFYRAQTTVKFLSKWIDSPIRLPFQIVCVWKPTIDGIGGRFSVREHSSRFFNFASANRNASERTLSIDTKTRTGNENENEAEGGNDSLNADNDNLIWLLIHTHRVPVVTIIIRLYNHWVDRFFPIYFLAMKTKSCLGLEILP